MSYLAYPKPDQQQSGCRISTYWYKDHSKAIEASKAAQHNGHLMEQQGHDFGFVSPGCLRFSEARQLWEVAIV